MVLGSVVLGAQPRIDNARVETRTVAGSLQREIDAVAARPGVAWIAYEVPMMDGRRQLCCWDGGRCRLEDGTITGVNSTNARVMLEPPAALFVFARVENGQVGRLRAFTPDCAIDGGGTTVVWLDGVRPAESVAWLSSLARGTSTDRGQSVGNSALSTLSLHAAPETVPALVAMARDDASSGARGQALFWLAQRAGREAMQAITAAIEDDPDTEVKKKAVFALSQMPKDDGVPKLIQVARTNRNPAVRKQAMFWLGESRDPRALQFFEEILLPK